MTILRAGSRVRLIAPTYLIVNAWSHRSAMDKLTRRVEGYFSAVRVLDSGGYLNTEITIEATTRGDYGNELHVKNLLEGMMIAEGFRLQSGASRFAVLLYASGSIQSPGNPYRPPPGETKPADKDARERFGFSETELVLMGVGLIAVWLLARR